MSMMFGPVKELWDGLPKLDLLFLAAFCFLLGFIGGTPYYHPDTLLDNALHTIANNGIPDYYNKPGLIVYANAAAYLITFLAMGFINAVGSFNDFSSLQQHGYIMTSPAMISMDTPGHLVTLSFSIFAVFIVYLWTLSLTRKRAYALLAGALLSTSLLWVANSHYLTVDVALGALCVATMYVAAYFTRRQGRLTVGQLSVLGILIGLTASAKYNGAIVIVPVAAMLLSGYWKDLRGFGKALIIVAVFSTLIFIITNPALFLDTRQYLDTFFAEYRHSSTGHRGFDTTGFALNYFVVNALPAGFGILPLLLSLVGALGVIRSRADISDKISLISFPLLYLAFMGAYKLTFDRYMVPMIPFLAILAAMGVFYIASCIRAGKGVLTWQNALVVTIIAACLVPGLALSVSHDVVLGKTDTRADLSTALKDSGLNDPEFQASFGTYIASDVTLSLNQSAYSKKDTGVPENIIDNSSDMIIIDSFSFDRVLYDPIGIDTGDFWTNASFFVIQMSPYNVPKDNVPFSPGSVYSPYLPDLTFRERPGPYIEIYCRNGMIADAIADACGRNGISCEALPGKEGYYYRVLGKAG
jgi:hypothetical protein